MVIKKLFLLSFIVIIGLLMHVCFTSCLSGEKSMTNPSNLKSSSDDIVVIDKVYNFTLTDPTLEFNDNLFFRKHYYYYITLTVVTPHICNMSIILWDPEGDRYNISYETNMTQDDYREIPYGTVLEGNYSIHFKAELTQNLNVHIKIERGEKSLYEKIDLNEREDIVYYNISKFNNEKTIEFTCDFRTDFYYKFYFERVSTISVKLSNYVGMDHDILDPQELTFIIYRNQSLGYTTYYFGTAVEGLCTMNITIYCDVEWVNIAYAVVEVKHLSDIVDPNDPNPPSDNPPSNTTERGFEAFIPFEGTVTVIVLAGMGVIIPCAIVVYKRKKNATNL